MRHAKMLLPVLLGLVVLMSARAGNTNSLAWAAATDRVSADVHGEALWPLLKDIAHQTGWHIFVEPGTDRKADVKFKELPRGEALRKLLGDLNFAFVPQTNGPDCLYVFATTMRNATERVAEKVKPAKHVANELLIKVKPGTDVEALAGSLGGKVIGRDEELGIYLLQFADAAATDAALAKFKEIPDVATVDYNYLYESPASPQPLPNAPGGPVSLALNPPGDSGRVIVGLVDTAVQPLGNDLDKFLLKPISVAGNPNLDSSAPTHATSMAETILQGIAAQGDSTSAQILPVDVYGPNALASTWNIAVGIQQAVNAGANPINLSLGSTTDSAFLDQVIQNAQAKGIVFFAAAGNDGNASYNYPAAVSGVYAVAATQGNQLASYSNYGNFIALALPGSSMVYLGGMSYVVQGTSPATAYASGIAAGAKSGTSLTWQQILGNMQQRFPVPGN